MAFRHSNLPGTYLHYRFVAITRYQRIVLWICIYYVRMWSAYERRVVKYSDRILRGAPVSDMPVSCQWRRAAAATASDSLLRWLRYGWFICDFFASDLYFSLRHNNTCSVCFYIKISRSKHFLINVDATIKSESFIANDLVRNRFTSSVGSYLHLSRVRCKSSLQLCRMVVEYKVSYILFDELSKFIYVSKCIFICWNHSS